MTYANHNAFALFGYSRDDFDRGANIFELLIPEDRESAKARFQRVLGGEKLSAREYTALRRDGTTFPVLVQTGLIIQENTPVGLRGIAVDITEQRRARQMMQHYITGIMRAQEAERNRIARELHDETAQSLVSLTMDIEAITRSAGNLPDNTLQLLQQLRSKLVNTTEEVRRICHELRPDVLDQVGLVPALRLLTEQLSKQGIASHVEIDGLERRLPPEVEVVLFRIAQEALHNVGRHSQATEAVVQLQFGDKQVSLKVVDNGRGFEVSEAWGEFASNGKLGLIGMRERARLLGASVSVESQPGKGAAVTVEVGA